MRFETENPPKCEVLAKLMKIKLINLKKWRRRGSPMCLKSDSDKILAGGLAKGSSASRGGARHVRLHRSGGYLGGLV